jgi:hypothetical protein
MSGSIDNAAPHNQREVNSITSQAAVYAARKRLQESVDQSDALEAIREIAANLMGTEEIAVYRVDETRFALWLYWSFGINPNRYPVLDTNRESNLRAAVEGKLLLRTDSKSPKLLSLTDAVNAIVPIVSNGVVSAVLIVFGLLAHKTCLDGVDRQICEVIANCASRAVEPRRS